MRLLNKVHVQEGEEPVESPTELMQQLNEALKELGKLMRASFRDIAAKGVCGCFENHTTHGKPQHGISYSA